MSRLPLAYPIAIYIISTLLININMSDEVSLALEMADGGSNEEDDTSNGAAAAAPARKETKPKKEKRKKRKIDFDDESEDVEAVNSPPPKSKEYYCGRAFDSPPEGMILQRPKNYLDIEGSSPWSLPDYNDHDGYLLFQVSFSSAPYCS